jgi:hypothetical protein
MQVEAHLLSTAALPPRPPPPARGGGGEWAGAGGLVRALVEGLEGRLGAERAREYRLLLAPLETREAVLGLTDQRLRDLGVSALAHRRLLLAHIEALRLRPTRGPGPAEGAGHLVHPDFGPEDGPAVSRVAEGSAEYAACLRWLQRWCGPARGRGVGGAG